VGGSGGGGGSGGTGGSGGSGGSGGFGGGFGGGAGGAGGFGGFGGNFTDGGPTGAPCTLDDECSASTFGLSFPSCNKEKSSDGGYTGWPGGYCSSFCFGSGDCPGANAFCAGDFFGSCYVSCPAPMGGQSTCRPGYLCDLFVGDNDGGRETLPDGGPKTTGYCGPRCDFDGGGCNYGLTCRSNGYCL
jgi:hypothetical protein